MAALTRIVTVLGVLGLLMLSCPSEAGADSLNFPDLSSYTPVNIDDYAIPYATPGHAPISMYYFRTSDDITCDFPNRPAAQCTGVFPGVSPAPPAQGVSAIGTDTGLRQTNDPLPSLPMGHVVKTLPPLHSITVYGVICGAGEAGMTACKDAQERGFVLSPTGSGWLPHV
jgi:hypothetical protein